jgi:inorganic pyrophosphatase
MEPNGANTELSTGQERETIDMSADLEEESVVPPPSAYSTVEVVSERNPDERRLYFTLRDHGYINALHDIPLYVDRERGIFNMVVEIPRWTNAKYELRTRLPLAPIMQDEKKGKPRFVQNVYPYKGYIWNYGCFPQTWEDPEQVHMETGALGDGDPLDVCEIGQSIAQVGTIKQVKVLGVLGMIDEGEMDWKVLVMDIRDPNAESLHDVDDLYRTIPGLVHATFSWFRTYKVPDGKEENKFAFRERLQSRQYALEIIEECHKSWERLVTGKVKHSNHHCSNTTLVDTPLYVPAADATKIVEQVRQELASKPGEHTEGGSKGGLEVHRAPRPLRREASISQLEKFQMPPFASNSVESFDHGDRLLFRAPSETIKHFLTEQQRQYPHGSSDLSLLITEFGTAAKIIASNIRDQPDAPFEHIRQNADRQLHVALAASGFCCMIYSTQTGRMMPLDHEAGIGNYVVVYTALAGEVGGTLGSLFSVYYRKSYSGREGDTADLLQRIGYEQVAAGYVLYSSSIHLVISSGLGAHMFFLDDISGHFVLRQKFLQIPSRGPIYSVDISSLPKAIDGVRQYIQRLEGSDVTLPARNTDTAGSKWPRKTFRYEHNVVGNFHRILRHGGILLMPGPRTTALADFLGVAAPLAFLARQAGGKASVGKRPVLELSAWTLDMRVPLFIGSMADVNDLEVSILGHPVPERSMVTASETVSYT